MTDRVVYRQIPRIAPERIASLSGLGVADLHDALPVDVRRRGLLHHTMRPVTAGISFAGQAVTVLSAPGDNLMMHCGLFLASRGDVLVIANGGVPEGALWGETATIDAMTQGLAGIVVDGPTRDTMALRRMQAPVWTTYISVTSPTKQGPGAVNVPVRCAGVTIHPGDVVVGDEDGVIAFAPVYIERIVEAVRGRSERESPLRERLRSGERLFNVFQIDKIAGQAGVAFHEGVWERGDET